VAYRLRPDKDRHTPIHYVLARKAAVAESAARLWLGIPAFTNNAINIALRFPLTHVCGLGMMSV